MLDTTVLNHIYNNDLTNKVRKAVDNGKLQLFATDVQKQEIAGIQNDEKRKQGIQQAVEEMQVEFIETSAAVIALDSEQESRRGFRGSKVGRSRIASDEDAELLKLSNEELKLSNDDDGELSETVSKLSTECLFENQADLLIFYTALEENMDYIVTGNTRDFIKPLEHFKMETGTKLQLITPKQFKSRLDGLEV
jgi:hypothetical protein